jgi:hypothetical protein
MAVFLLKILNGFQYLSSIKSADSKIALYDIVLAALAFDAIWRCDNKPAITILRGYKNTKIKAIAKLRLPKNIGSLSYLLNVSFSMAPPSR